MEPDDVSRDSATPDNVSPAHEAAPLPPPPEPASSSPAAGEVPMPKKPLFAGFLSLFPGAGNIYNGLYLRGVTFFVLAAGTIYMAANRGELWGFVVAFVWIFNVLDAWRQASLINLGITTDLGLTDQPKPTAYGYGGVIAGGALLLVGLLAAFEIYLGLDIDWILNLWPLFLMALGAWFVWSSVRAKLASREKDEPL